MGFLVDQLTAGAPCSGGSWAPGQAGRRLHRRGSPCGGGGLAVDRLVGNGARSGSELLHGHSPAPRRARGKHRGGRNGSAEGMPPGNGHGHRLRAWTRTVLLLPRLRRRVRPVRHPPRHRLAPPRGRTNLDNLLPLCSRHHHLVHEGRWRTRPRQAPSHHHPPTRRKPTLPRARHQQNQPQQTRRFRRRPPPRQSPGHVRHRPPSTRCPSGDGRSAARKRRRRPS